MRTSLPLASVAIALLSLVACSDDSAATSNGTVDGGTTGSADGATGVSLNEGYKKATWSSGVTVTFGDCTMRFQSNGLPNHARDAEYALPNAGVRVPSATSAYAAADPSVAQNYDVTVNTCPTFNATTTATPLGNIGYMISGASLFNPYEGDGTTVALASNFSVKNSSGKDVFFVDSCNAHPTPNGLFHYHGLPTCVTATVDTANGPSHILGIAADGFPIYGNRDANGTEVTASQLDACNGITSPTPEFPGGVYHYVLLNTTDGSSSLRCYRGTAPASSEGGGGGGGMGGPPRPSISGGSDPAAANALPNAIEPGCAPNVPLADRDPQPLRRLAFALRQAL